MGGGGGVWVGGCGRVGVWVGEWGRGAVVWAGLGRRVGWAGTAGVAALLRPVVVVLVVVVCGAAGCFLTFAPHGLPSPISGARYPISHT